MSNYEIQIHIQIRPTDDDVSEASQQDDEGRFRTVVSGATGQRIDACEQALLGLNYQPFARRYRATSVRCRVRKPVMVWAW